MAENVKGAQPWIGRARYHYGSFYLWGDVPCLMPNTTVRKISGYSDPRRNGGKGAHLTSQRENDGRKVPMNFHEYERTGKPDRSFQSVAVDGLKVPGIHLSQIGFNVAAARKVDASRKPEHFHQSADMKRQHIGYTRKAASAQIAKIPFPLAQHIARVFKP